MGSTTLHNNRSEDGILLACRFIRWTQETYASGGHQAELIPLLERCMRELQALPQYKDDVRYLRVWIQYVSGPCSCPCNPCR